MALNLTVVSPERTVVAGLAASRVNLPGNEGQIQILADHGDMIGTLETGPFRFELEDGSVQTGAISYGFFKVHKNEVLVLADTLELGSEIDPARAASAQDKAQKQLIGESLDDTTFEKQQLKLQRALIRQQASAGK